MKENPISSAMKNIRLGDGAKEEIKAACREQMTVRNLHCGFCKRTAFKVIAAAMAIAVMTISVFAVSKLITFSMTQKNDEVRINAALPEENKDTDAPVRSWNSDKEAGEISVRLEFAYMPEDMSEDMTASHKYGGSVGNRAITFNGYDLRRSDLNAIIKNIDSAEKFMAGDKEAYLLISNDLSVYDKDIYVLFAQEEMVVHGIVGYGITVEEIKAIAEGMSIAETDDVIHALPIGNEPKSSDVPDIPFVFVHDDPKVYRSDLLAMGEVGTYENVFESMRSVNVEKVEMFDSISGFEDGVIRKDLVEKFTDAGGNLIPYNRTEVIINDDDVANGGKVKRTLGETLEMTKRFICVTVTATGDTDENMKPFLHTFSLGGLAETEEGTIERTQGRQNFWIDGVPGEYADTHEPVYRKKVGEGRWVLGYLLDADEIGDELYFYSSYAELHYVLNP